MNGPIRMHWEDFNKDCEAASTGFHKRGCGVGRLFADIPEEAKTAIRKALANQNVTTSGIHNELVKRLGDSVPSRSTLTRHRKGECGCPKENA